MDRSLTVVLPVHGAQETLGATVEDLLDVLPELTERFEVVIVDNGSMESASEVAHGLARNYPQVKVVRRSNLSNREAAMRTGLEQSTGEVVFLREDPSSRPLCEIHRLWQAMGEAEDGLTSSPVPTGYRIVRRAEEAESQAQPRTASKPSRPNYLGRTRQRDRRE